MVNIEYYKRIVKAYPIKDLIVTQTTQGISVNGVPRNIENIISLSEFNSGRIRVILYDNTLKFTYIDTLEYIKLSKIMKELNDDGKIEEIDINGLPILIEDST